MLAAVGVTYLYVRKPAQAPPSAIEVAVIPERISREAYIFTSAADFAMAATLAAIFLSVKGRRRRRAESAAMWCRAF